MKNFLPIFISLMLSACFSGSPDTPYLWAWISGSDVVDKMGVYGTEDVADPANVPGAREQAVTWRDDNNNLWLFGGYGYDSVGTLGYLNDLWKFDGTNWTWISGSNLADDWGDFDGPSYWPSARQAAVSWRDGSGNLWILGGYGKNNVGTNVYLDDMWMYTPATDTWTLVSGTAGGGTVPVYLTKGSPGGEPGARKNALAWYDGNGNLWLFGGLDRDGARRNDLWKYDVSTDEWTWISGDGNSATPEAVYGTQGVAHVDNKPGARSGAVAWIDGNGDLWMFGGDGYDESTPGLLNDVWKYDVSENQWIWMSGDMNVDNNGTYGTRQVASSDNIPGGRQDAIAQVESNGDVWVFGGYGYDESTVAPGYLNDLWRFDGSNWTWISGSDVVDQTGSYGVKGTANPSNTPGARRNAVSWIKSYAEIWIFGGYGYDDVGSLGYLNDLWRFVP